MLPHDEDTLARLVGFQLRNRALDGGAAVDAGGTTGRRLRQQSSDGTMMRARGDQRLALRQHVRRDAHRCSHARPLEIYLRNRSGWR